MHLALRRNSPGAARNMPCSGQAFAQSTVLVDGDTLRSPTCAMRGTWADIILRSGACPRKQPCSREHGQPTRRTAVLVAKRSATALSNSSTAGEKQLL